MPKASRPGYYAVPRGRVPGIYTSWAECEAQVKGFPGAAYKKLSTETEAIEFMTAKSSSSTSRDIAPLPAPKVRPRAVEVPEDEKDCDIVYCDGACRGNGQPGSIAGIGVWWGHGDPRNISERCPGDQTNNQAELIAIVRILETTPPLERRLVIKTDSNYSIKCVTLWIFNWMRNGFLAADGKPVKNRALVKYLAALLHARRKSSQTVEFKHVRGHAGIEGNEAADQLASLGAAKSAVPERDWENLEAQVLQSLKPVKPINIVDNDLKAYADGLSSDDELAELTDTNVHNATTPRRQSKRQQSKSGRDATPVSPIPQAASPSRASVAAHRTSGVTTRSMSRLRSAGSPRPAAVAAQVLPSVPSKKPTTATISKKELEAYASCLLGDDELSTVGKNGVFDSDF